MYEDVRDKQWFEVKNIPIPIDRKVLVKFIQSKSDRRKINRRGFFYDTILDKDGQFWIEQEEGGKITLTKLPAGLSPYYWTEIRKREFNKDYLNDTNE